MRNEPQSERNNHPMSVGKALAAIACLLGIVLAFVFGFAAIIKWTVS